MGFSKDQLLTRLQELQIDYLKYEHPPVLTVEEMLNYVNSTLGAPSKNLCLKDKKNRFYIVSAMPETKVDMKVLSQRLGLGKGGLRMAPEEALVEILQVPLGSVTPFAVVNETAKDVSLLLDRNFRSHARCLFHPLSNDATIALSTADLDKFLKSVGRDPVYVDLEANPMVGKDQPPDLAPYVPAGPIALPENPDTKASQQMGPVGNHTSRDNKSAAAPAKAGKLSGKVQNAKGNSAPAPASSLPLPPSSFKDPQKFVEEILDKTSKLLLSEVNEETVKQQGDKLGAALGESLRKQLMTEFTHLAMMYKNTAYTEGFHAGAHHQPKRV